MHIPPPPPATASIEAPGSAAFVIRLRPGTASCAGSAVSGTIEPPFPTTTRLWPGAKSPDGASYVLTFSLDPSGRPTGIRRRDPSPTGFWADTADLTPSLAASRFAATSRSGCEIAYSVETTPIAEAAPSLLREVASAPDVGGAASELLAKLDPDGGCARGPGSPRRLEWPAFEGIAQRPGTRSWTFLTFDVDADGRTRNVRTAGSSGNAALDAAGRKSLGRNRYAPGHPATGCPYHFYRASETPVPAPEMPGDAPADNGEEPGCAIDPKSISGLLGGDAYPAGFLARRIEGWAIVGYDTAPWGQIGDARVMASEPDEAFGVAALQSIANGKVAESDTGRRGCVRRIRFRMPASGFIRAAEPIKTD